MFTVTLKHSFFVFQLKIETVVINLDRVQSFSASNMV